MIAGILLAAGLARRMGRQKLLLSLEGKPVVRWAVERLLPHVEDLVVVTGHDDSTVRHALSGLAVRFAVNPRPEAGQASSIAVGVEALRPRTRAVLVALGDQPKTPDPVVPALLSAFARSGKPIVVSIFRCRPTWTRPKTTRSFMYNDETCVTRFGRSRSSWRPPTM